MDTRKTTRSADSIDQRLSKLEEILTRMQQHDDEIFSHFKKLLTARPTPPPIDVRVFQPKSLDHALHQTKITEDRIADASMTHFYSAPPNPAYHSTKSLDHSFHQTKIIKDRIADASMAHFYSAPSNPAYHSTKSLDHAFHQTKIIEDCIADASMASPQPYHTTTQPAPRSNSYYLPSNCTPPSKPHIPNPTLPQLHLPAPSIASHKPSVEVCWAPMLVAFTVPLDQSDDEAIISLWLEGCRHAIHITAVMSMKTQREAFVISLAKFISHHGYG